MYHKWTVVAKDLLNLEYTEYAWQYITAIRGSDNGDGILKDILTAVIRGDTLDSGSIGMPIERDANWLADNLYERYKLTAPSDHYLDHCRWGLGALSKWYSMQGDIESSRILDKYLSIVKHLEYNNEKKETWQALANTFADISEMWVEE